MTGLLWWLWLGLAGLVLVAMFVAGWEHLARDAARRNESASAPLPLLSVDVPLDALGGDDGDTAARREALDGALGRMARAGASDDSRRAWLETTPTVGPGSLGEPARPAASRDSEAAGLG